MYDWNQIISPCTSLLPVTLSGASGTLNTGSVTFTGNTNAGPNCLSGGASGTLNTGSGTLTGNINARSGPEGGG